MKWSKKGEVMKFIISEPIPANKEPFLNQLARVILVHNWYRSTSMCFHVYSRVLPVVTNFERV